MVSEVVLRMVRAGLDHVLADMLRAGAAAPAGTLNGTFLGLLTVVPNYTPGMVLAGTTEANFTGYVRQAITWSGLGVGPEGRSQIIGEVPTFAATDDVNPNTIRAVGLYSAVAAGTLLAVGYLATPIEMSSAGAQLDVSPKVAVPGAATVDWGIGAAVQ